MKIKGNEEMKRTNWLEKKRKLRSTLVVYKCESIRIRDQEHYKMIQRVFLWVPVPVKPCTLVEDVSPRFDGVAIARTWKVHVGKEP